MTALFSGSLYFLASGVSFAEVLVTGMIVPSFTWVVQSSAAALLMNADMRWRYWAALGRICLLGSVALVPAAVLNLCFAPPLWPSVANVVASVLVMAAALFVLSRRACIDWRWPASWCATIACNMAIFATVSWHWWG